MCNFEFNEKSLLFSAIDPCDSDTCDTFISVCKKLAWDEYECNCLAGYEPVPGTNGKECQGMV